VVAPQLDPNSPLGQYYALKSLGLKEWDIKSIADKDYPIDTLIPRLNEIGYRLDASDDEAVRGIIRAEYNHILEARKSGQLDPEKMYYPGNADYDVIHAPTSNQRKSMPPPQEIRVASMETYDTLRRQLDDIGTVGTKGYDAELANHAREISKGLRAALDQHLPQSFKTRMIDYHDQAQATNIFRTRLGKALTDETPMGGEKTQSHRAAELAFAGLDSAQKLKGLVGDQNTFDEIALTHISSNLKGKDSAQAAKWLDVNYKDWSSELSPAARKRVEAHIDELKNADLMGAAAKLSQKATAGKAAKIPAETESKVSKIIETLTGDKKSVPRIVELLTTKKLNEDEARAVYTALQNTPDGKDAFKRAVESVIKDSEPKNILETFDNQIYDTLIAAGSHTPQEAQQLRGIVKELDELAHTKVASTEDQRKLIKAAANKEMMKGAAIGVVLGGITGGMAASGHLTTSGVLGGGEAVGLYMARGGYQRMANRVDELIQNIIADKDLFNAAIAPPTEGNVMRLLGFLAKYAQKTGAVEGAEYPVQREKRAVRTWGMVP
jgi:hypothetical protein